jgi:hypothetical protein
MIKKAAENVPRRGYNLKLRERVVPLCLFQSSSSGQVWNSGTSQTGQTSCKAKFRSSPRLPPNFRGQLGPDGSILESGPRAFDGRDDAIGVFRQELQAIEQMILMLGLSFAITAFASRRAPFKMLSIDIPIK